MSNYQQNYNQASAQQNAMQPRKPKFSAMIQTPAYQKSLQNSLSNPKEIQKFTAAITSVVSTNPLIEECVAVKERIVKSDPRETGFRKVLNCLTGMFGYRLEIQFLQTVNQFFGLF